MSLLQKVKNSFFNNENDNGDGNGKSGVKTGDNFKLPQGRSDWLNALKESEFRHRNLIHGLPAAIYTTDKEGYITLYNEAAVELWGRRPEIGKEMWCGSWKIYQPDGITPVSLDSCPMGIALKEGRKVNDQEIIIERPDGTRRNVMPHPEPIFDKKGNIVGAVNMLLDITEQKIAEENMARLAAIVQSSDDAILSKTLDGVITSWNAAAQRLFGYREEEIIGQPVTKLIPPDRIEEEILILTRLGKGERVEHFETKRITKDGKLLDISLTISPVKDSKGKIIGISKIARDITEQKIAEENMARLAAIVQSSDDAILSKTPDGIITSWNAAAERLFGYREEEIIGQPVTRLIPPDRMEEETLILARLRKGERVEHFETKRITKDGKLLDISLTISPVKDSKGKIIGISKIARDITVQKKLNEGLRESEERLRIATEAAELGTWDLDLKTGRSIPSLRHQEIFGYNDPENWSSEKFFSYVHPEEMESTRKFVEEAFKTGSIAFETRILKDDKSVRWLKINTKALFEKDIPVRLLGTVLDITEEKQADQLLKENEERLRMAIESTRLGTWEYHPLTKEISCSEECKIIFGVPGDFIPGNEFVYKHTHPDDREFVKLEVKKATDPDGSGNCEIEYRIIRDSDNEVRWVKVRGKAFFNSKRQPERFIGTMLDISEEKTQQEELRESVELFQTMADNVPAMIWMSGTDKFDDYFNKTWLEFTGRTIEEESNEGWLEGVHPDDIQKCIDTYNTSFREQKGFYLEYRLRRHDGHYRWIADKSVPRYSPDEEFLGFITACIDIDDQKRFREKIQDSELLFKTISNASPAGLWLTDEEGQNIFVNDTWIHWTGRSLDQQLLQGWVGSVIEEDTETVVNKFHLSFTQRKYFNTEFRFRKTDGQLRWGLAEGYPYYDITETFAGYAGSITDITEIKKLEQRKDDFIKMASHELKTPITSISGYVQLLQNIYNESDNERLHSSKSIVRSSLGTISKQVAKLTRLITELLDLSKIESGKLELNKTEFDLASLVEETVQDVRHTTAKHAIILHNDFEGKLYADKDRIAQVLLNLLTNAVKYSPDSDAIEIYVEGAGKFVMMRIRDHGIGIEKKEHQKIFERFYRAEGKSEQTYPGFGIGLFIASEIIHRHQGTISVESEKGNGAEFTVMLPLNLKRKD